MTLLNCNDSTAGLQIRLSMLPAGWPSRQSRSVLDRSMRSSVIELVNRKSSTGQRHGMVDFIGDGRSREGPQVPTPTSIWL